jgi:hypothetical protein
MLCAHVVMLILEFELGFELIRQIGGEVMIKFK